MRQTILTIYFLTVLLNCFSQQKFYYNLTGIKNKTKSIKVFIEYEIGGIKIIDSLIARTNNFSIKKQIRQPVAATIYTDNEALESLPVFLANNVIRISITETINLVGKSKIQEDFLYLTSNDRVRPTYFSSYAELNAKNDTVGLNKLAVIFDSLKTNDISKSYEYFKSNKSSVLGFFAFSRFSAFLADYSKVEDDYNLLPLWAKNSPDGKNIAFKIQGAKSAQIGTEAKEFSQQTSTGQKISLSNYRGKYVLLDFWASWCGPCRKEHPNLIKAYQLFNSQNFEIISVSLDNNKQAWLNAIAKDKLIWTQISDLKGQQNDIALMYGVQSIPASFLISPDGRIIDKDLRGEQLIDKLATLLK